MGGLIVAVLPLVILSLAGILLDDELTTGENKKC
jgi:hypothetical protein